MTVIKSIQPYHDQTDHNLIAAGGLLARARVRADETTLETVARALAILEGDREPDASARIGYDHAVELGNVLRHQWLNLIGGTVPDAEDLVCNRSSAKSPTAIAPSALLMPKQTCEPQSIPLGCLAQTHSISSWAPSPPDNSELEVGNYPQDKSRHPNKKSGNQQKVPIAGPKSETEHRRLMSAVPVKRVGTFVSTYGCTQ